MSPPAEYRPGAAVAWMLCAVAVLCLMDACLKQLSGHYPALQVAALRGLVGLPLVLAWAGATVGLRALLRVHADGFARTVADADKVVVLDGGRVAESGTPAELAEADGLFARMLDRQRRGAAA